MRFTFWGVRGSIPVPGSHTVRYGGNTTCIEVRTDSNDLIILDAGTGIFQLAQRLQAEMPLEAHLFISHTHWDHIQGLPFFTPLFVPGNTVRIYGGADPHSGRSIRDVLARQMEYAFFPVSESELQARIEYTTLQEGQAVQVGSARIDTLRTGHPVLNFAYRIECSGKRLVFTGDHEWPWHTCAPDDPGWAEAQAQVAAQREAMIAFFAGADALIIDSAYTPDEYPKRQGWGHGTFDSSIAAAREAGVKQVWLTHHEPTRSDDRLEALFQEAMERTGVSDGDPLFFLAREGETVEVR